MHYRFVNTSSNKFHISHKYLAQHPPTNEFSPASIERIINRIQLNQQPDVTISKPVAVIVSKSEPYIWAPWTDMTRTRVAFGVLGVPKLKKELSSKHTLTICQALSTLSDLLHDPEKANEVFHANVHVRFVKLLVHDNPFVRQRTLMCLELMAKQAFGAVKMSQNRYLLRNLKLCLQDESFIIKNQTISTIHSFLFNCFSRRIFIEEGYVKTIINCLIHYKESQLQEFYDENSLVTLVESLTYLIQDSDIAKIEAMAYDIFLLIDLIAHNNCKIRNSMALAFCELFKHKIGRLASYHWPFIEYLTNGLDTEEPWHNLGLVSTLRFATIAPECRKQAMSYNLIDKLINLIKHTIDTEIFLCVIQILTNMAEYPEGREKLRTYTVEKKIYPINKYGASVKQHILQLFNTINKPL